MRLNIMTKAAALLLALALSACAAEKINPVTGKRIYTPVSAAAEAQVGEQASAEMAAQYGVYEDAALTAYVDRVGQALARHAVRKDIKYSFTILDDDSINAFALPGGYVYITRGALNFAGSEAELAATLGHEIGHIDAFHFRRTERDTVSGVLSVLLRQSSQGADDLAMAQKLEEKSTKGASYSQAQEYEADALGIHYMALAGYDPQAAVRELNTEHAKSQLDDYGMKGNPVAHNIFALDQSHPATPDRVRRAQEAANAAAAKLPVTEPPTSQSAAGTESPGDAKAQRDAYLAAIDGMVFGVDPGQGKVEGRRLVHPDLGFSFEAPEDFDLWTSHKGAFGVGSNAVLVMEAATAATSQSMVSYVESSFTDEIPVASVRTLDLDNWRGATGIVDLDPFVIRVGAVHNLGTRVFRLLYVTPRRGFSDRDAGFIDSLKSLRPLTVDESKPKPPLRLRVVTVSAGDTVQKLADRMALPERKAEWFRVLNGIEPGEEVQPGDKVKLVE